MIQGGKSVDYVVELSGLNVMYRQGWNRKSVQVGDRLKVTVHPRRDSTSNGSFAGAVKADGTILRGTAPQ